MAAPLALPDCEVHVQLHGECVNAGLLMHCMQAMSDFGRASMSWMGFAHLRLVVSSADDGTVIPFATGIHPMFRDVNIEFHARFGLDRSEILVHLIRRMLEERADGSVEVAAAEIGVDHGETSEALLTNLPGLTLFLVDPFEFADANYFVQEKFRSSTFAARTSETLMARLQPFRNRSILMCQPSSRAVNWIAPKSLDFVFIHGDHSYNAARNDIRTWRTKLRPGGILAGHDYFLWFPG
ncbi:unnamed protein product, partial [Polarella glacialis]